MNIPAVTFLWIFLQLPIYEYSSSYLFMNILQLLIYEYSSRYLFMNIPADTFLWIFCSYLFMNIPAATFLWIFQQIPFYEYSCSYLLKNIPAAAYLWISIWSRSQTTQFIDRQQVKLMVAISNNSTVAAMILFSLVLAEAVISKYIIFLTSSLQW